MRAGSDNSDKPVEDRHAATVGELLTIVMHPAFRLGFLDARAGLPINHDKIVDRIFSETPAGALQRLGIGTDLFGDGGKRCQLAQYRYEEGRLLFLEYGVRCKAWGHPDFPPAQVRRFVTDKFKSIETSSGSTKTC